MRHSLSHWQQEDKWDRITFGVSLWSSPTIRYFIYFDSSRPLCVIGCLRTLAISMFSSCWKHARSFRTHTLCCVFHGVLSRFTLCPFKTIHSTGANINVFWFWVAESRPLLFMTFSRLNNACVACVCGCAWCEIENSLENFCWRFSHRLHFPCGFNLQRCYSYCCCDVAVVSR